MTLVLVRPKKIEGQLHRLTEIRHRVAAPWISLAHRDISLRCNGSSAFGANRTSLDLLMARPGRE